MLFRSIANTSRKFQAKLLRVLQDRQVRRLGDLAFRALDIRVIAATNVDLRSLAARGEFRDDLYYRLSVAPLHVPPLRARPAARGPTSARSAYAR